MTLDLLGSAAVGSAGTFLLLYFGAIRPLINDIRRMQYDGFKIAPPPQKPKLVPEAPFVRED